MSFKTLFSLVALIGLVNGAVLKKRATCPDGSSIGNDACCAFAALRDDLLTNLYNGGCNEEVHEVVRLAFHDAIAFSPSAGGGGADGSMILFPNDEPNFPQNAGIINPVQDLTPFFNSHNVSAGDLIQLAAATAISLCPGAPRINFLAGRPNAKAPAPLGLIPEPTDSVATILARFNDAAGFTSDEVVALLASHSIARADHVDPTVGAVPFDSTPFTMDTQFFVEVLLKGTGFPGSGANDGEVESPLPDGQGEDVGEMRLQSDAAFARDPTTACTFQNFVNDQDLMRQQFKLAFEKLALVGQDTSSFIDCSEVIPAQAPEVTKPATFPAGKSNADVEQACAATPFPTLATDPGAATVIPHCPPGQDECDD